jgi:two-component system LytT family response regulator
MTLQAIAIDDEAPALAVIASHAAKVPFVQLQATFVSPTEALAWLQNNPVDLIFSDIQMPDLFGTEFMRLAKSSGALFVFVTAYPQYAVEGFQLQALDYLLKPVELSRFIETCNRALQQKQTQSGQQNSIFVKDGHDWLRIQITDIEFIRSDTNLLFIHHAGQVTVTRMTIGRLLELLPAGEFVRVHKSYTVALKAVKKIERHQLTVGGAFIPVARSYREEVERLLLG